MVENGAIFTVQIYPLHYKDRTQKAYKLHKGDDYHELIFNIAGNSLVTCEFPSQRPVTRSFYVFFDQRQNKRLSKQ